MPKYQHDNFGDVMDTLFAKGVITSVDSDNDTACFTGEGCQSGTDIPLFYHCEPNSEERDNGAIEGAAAGFNVEDEVIVMCTADGVPVRIVGFVDGIKDCTVPLILIRCPNAYSVYDTKTNAFLQINDENGDPVEFPVERLAGMQTEHLWIDYDTFLEPLNGWQQLWGWHPDYGTYSIPEEHQPSKIYDGYKNDENDWMIETVKEGTGSDNSSPAATLFGDTEGMWDERYFIQHHRWYDLSNNLHITTMKYIQWDNEYSYDDCNYFIANNGSDEVFDAATRWHIDSFYDKSYSLAYDNISGSTSFDLDFSIFKADRKEKIQEIHIPFDYFSDLYLSTDSLFDEKYMERRQPWDFNPLFEEYEEYWKAWYKMSDVYLSSAYNFFGANPWMGEIAGVFSIEDWMEGRQSGVYYAPNDCVAAYNDDFNPGVDPSDPRYSWFAYSFTDGTHWDVYFHNDVPGDPFPAGTCMKVLDTFPGFTYEGTAGCPWLDNACPECTEESSSGLMYELHNQHNTFDLVPNEILEFIAQGHANDMASGEVPFGHDGLEARMERVLDLIDCSEYPISENVYKGDPAAPTPIETCFQAWLDSPEHRFNIENDYHKMIGCGQAGEYFCTIFAGWDDECENDDWCFTPAYLLKHSDESLRKLKERMGLAPGTAFPWAGVTIPAEGYDPLGATYNGTHYYPFWKEILSDSKLRIASYDYIRPRGIFCDEEDEINGIVNCVVAFPFGINAESYIPSDLYEENEDKILDTVHVHASIDIGSGCDVTQSPHTMERCTELEEAIAETIRVSAHNEHGVFMAGVDYPTLSIHKLSGEVPSF